MAGRVGAQGGRSPAVALTRPVGRLSTGPVGRGVCGHRGFLDDQDEDPVPGRHVTDQQVRIYMEFRRQHTQVVAAAKAGVSERTARRIERVPRLPSQRPTGRKSRRQVADALDGLWGSDILPLLAGRPGLRPIGLLVQGGDKSYPLSQVSTRSRARVIHG